MASPNLLPDFYVYEKDYVLNETLFPFEAVERVKTFEMSEGDVAVVTYPKAGTTWMQELLYQIQTGVNTDSEKSRTHICSRVPFMEEQPQGTPSFLDQLQALPRPYMTKSHLMPHCFEKQLVAGKGKFIVVMRNVKDNLVSYFHFYQALKPYNFSDGSWQQFFQMFKEKTLCNGDWLDFNLSWWKYRDNPNVLIVKYEDMKRDARAVILQMSEFVGKPVTEEQITKLIEHTSFDKAKDNAAMNYSTSKFYDCSVSPFMRKGAVGTWQSLITAEQDDFIEANYVKEAEKQGLYFECK